MMQQLLFLAAMWMVGVFISYWMRRVEAQGLEIWLPFSIILSFAISPVAGFVFAFSLLLASWFLFPYRITAIIIISLFLIPILVSTAFFDVSQTNFVRVAMLLTVVYNVLSNAFFLLLRANYFKILKFIVFSLWVSWIIYSRFGWALISWLSAI